MRPLVAPALAALLLSTAAGQTQAERLVLVAGGGTEGDGARADKAELTTPFGIGFQPDGALIFVEMTGERVRKVGRDGTVTTIAGSGRKGNGGDGGPAAKAEFNGMHSLTVARNGDIYLTDTWNNRVRKIDAGTGVITNVAGTGHKGFSGDGGDATKAGFGGIYCLALDEAHQKLYLDDLDNGRIRVIDLKTGVVSTAAGNGKKGKAADDADARSFPLSDPRAVAVDGKQNLYILERGGHRLRVVEPSGKVRTIAGTGKAGFSGDGGPAIKAAMNGPKHLCVTSDGKVYIADTENHRIRLYTPGDGTIRTVAGNGRKGAVGLNGPPTEAELNQPHGVTIGPDGLLYIADSTNNRILKVVP